MTIYEKIIPPIDARVLVLDHSNTLSFAAAVDPMRATNRHGKKALFQWHMHTPLEKPVSLTSGLSIPAAAINRVEGCDLLFVIASFDIFAQSTPQLHASLRRLSQKAKYVIGVDGGPWIMAQAGLLEGHDATVHWEDIAAFSAQFPNVNTRNTRYQISGNRLTSAGATPTLDLMLELILQNFGPQLARQVAASFVMDHTPLSNAPQSRNPLPKRHNSVTARAQSVMEENLEHPMSLQELARQVGVSARVMQMHFQRHLQQTAQQHYLQIRLQEARRLVLMSDRSLLDVAMETGFTSQSSFSRAYRAAFGTSARQERGQ